MAQRRRLIGVVGAGNVDPIGAEKARAVGRLLAEAGVVLVCGGLGGVMEAACKGASEAGGVTIGLLPGPDSDSANPYVSLPLATNLGHARNVLIAQSCEALIAVGGEYGTLSEMALGLKIGRRVVALGCRFEVEGLVIAASPEEAVRLALGVEP